MAEAEPQAGTVTTEVAARLLMLTPARLGQLVAEGWIERAERGRYPLVGLVQGYIRFLKDEQRRASKSAAESRVRDARAREIELRTAREERRLVEIDEALSVLDEVVGAVRAELSGVPARVTRDLTLRRQIEQDIDGALTRVADRLDKKASALRAGGEPAEADAEDDA